MPPRRERLLRQLSKGRFGDEAIKTVVDRSGEFSAAMIREVIVSALTRAAIEGRDVKDTDLPWACNIMREEMEKAKVGFEKRKKIGLNPDEKKAQTESYAAVPASGGDENPWGN